MLHLYIVGHGIAAYLREPEAHKIPIQIQLSNAVGGRCGCLLKIREHLFPFLRAALLESGLL